MGKKGGGGSWLAAVKRAFRSPTKDHPQKTTRKRDQDHLDDDQLKKREKKRWLFRKSTQNASQTQEEEQVRTPLPLPLPLPNNHKLDSDDKHAISVAEAAVLTANAAVETIRLTRRTSSNILADQHFSAIVIQTAFRGYLARRALRALKGIVTLQALVRGQNVRRQAKMTLKCMQALLRVQARLRDQQRPRVSHDVVRKSMFAETTTNLWESKYLQDIRQRKSTSGDERCMGDDWDEVPRTLEELDAILKSRKEAAIKREKSLAYAFSQQFDSHTKIRKSSRNPSFGDEKELEGPNWRDYGGIATKQWERPGSSRGSFDRREPIKTLEVDMSRPYSNSPASYLQKSPYSNQQYPYTNSPNHRSSHNVQPPVTPSPSKTRPLHVRSASPRCLSYSNANTPSLRSSGRFNASMCRYSSCGNDVAVPNYMAATESARARVRPQSAPRQRPSTPDRERSGSAKKRLAYPCGDDEMSEKDNYLFSFSQNLRSPSFKSVQVGHVGMGNMSCYAESVGGGEISPCSTTELRRWFR